MQRQKDNPNKRHREKQTKRQVGKTTAKKCSIKKYDENVEMFIFDKFPC